MIVTVKKYCDRCGKSMRDGVGADVYKHTVACRHHPVRHLCERCYAEVFVKQISEEKEMA